jgi:hypothetical protein
MAPYYNHHEVTQEPYLSVEMFKDYISHKKTFNRTIRQTFKGHPKCSLIMEKFELMFKLVWQGNKHLFFKLNT